LDLYGQRISTHTQNFFWPNPTRPSPIDACHTDAYTGSGTMNDPDSVIFTQLKAIGVVGARIPAIPV
jgi:hypothetical protein